MRLLDICCGPGHATAEAAARGLSVIGIDFAPAMVDEACRLFPDLDFRVGDAEALDFHDASFDAAICGFLRSARAGAHSVRRHHVCGTKAVTDRLPLRTDAPVGGRLQRDGVWWLLVVN